LRTRIQSYFQKSRPRDPRLSILIKKINDLEFIVTDTEIEALILEANLIKEHKPKFNINLKDDKSFPYIRITHELFPQVYTTRNVIRDGSTYFGPYTNVKDMRHALTTLKRLFAIRSCKFQFTEEMIQKKKVKLCLEYYIKKCKGPCQGLQNPNAYLTIIEQAKQFLKGKTNTLLNELYLEMAGLSAGQAFEEAAQVRDKIFTLEKYIHGQKIVLPDKQDRDIFAVAQEDDDACAVIFKVRDGKLIGRMHYYLAGALYKKSQTVLEYFLNQYYTLSDEIPSLIYIPYPIENKALIEEWLNKRSHQKVVIQIPKIGEKKKLLDMCAKNAAYLLNELHLQKMAGKFESSYAVKTLQRDLKLNQPPNHIECFDISNIQGTDPVASMVCFINGNPRKNEYRKYKIQIKMSPDDFAMMAEVIRRRFTRLLNEKQTLPDLIIVDGGKGQLSSARKELIKLNLGKQPIIGLAKRLEEIYLPGFKDAQMLPKTSASLKLLQKIRDEAHRFAVTFHRQRRRKRIVVSELEKIPGIGPSRRTLLLKQFGSVKKIKEADIRMLIAHGKLPENLARTVYDHFHPIE
jgi:excinuclease ABC subunit C